MLKEDLEAIKSYQTKTDDKRSSFYTKAFLLQDLLKSKMEVYEAVEGSEPIDVAIYSELYAYKKFIDGQINDLNNLLSNYDDLVNILGEIIKELDTKNVYKIEEILHMD